jgi:hypothetical protein
MAGMAALVAQGRLGRATQVWAPGMAGWQAAGQVPALGGLMSRLPPPPPQG